MCSLGIKPTTFCAADAMLYHWATQEHCLQRKLTSFFNIAFNIAVLSDSKPYGYKETKYQMLYLAGLTVLSLCFVLFLFFRDWVLWDWFKLCWQPVFVATHNSLLYLMTDSTALDRLLRLCDGLLQTKCIAKDAHTEPFWIVNQFLWSRLNTRTCTEHNTSNLL